MSQKISPELVKEHGLSQEEYGRIKGLLGREPSSTRLGSRPSRPLIDRKSVV